MTGFQRQHSGIHNLSSRLRKNLTACCIFKKLSPEGLALIIAPKKVHPHWEEELRKPDIPRTRYILINPEKLVRDPAILEKIKNRIGFLIIDEAHILKIYFARITQLLPNHLAYRKIPGPLLSATPVRELYNWN